MGIFLSESFTNAINKPAFDSSYLQSLCEELKIDEKAIQNRFGNENAGMAICYESEVAWNTLMEEMKATEFAALQGRRLGRFLGQDCRMGKEDCCFLC